MAQTPNVHHGFTKSWIGFDRPSWRKYPTLPKEHIKFNMEPCRISNQDDRHWCYLGYRYYCYPPRPRISCCVQYIICNRAIVGTWAYLEGIYFAHLEANSDSTAAPTDNTGLLQARRVLYYAKSAKHGNRRKRVT